MKLIKRLLFWLVALILFCIFLLAAVDNSALVALTFFAASTPELPVSWWVFGAFVLGIVVASLLNICTGIGLRLIADKTNNQTNK